MHLNGSIQTGPIVHFHNVAIAQATGKSSLAVEGPVGTYIDRRIWRRPSNSVPVRKDVRPFGGNVSAGTVQTAATTPRISKSAGKV
jgi:hypothetical protein